MPKKRDKFNKRYGFVKVRQEQDVNDIIQGLKYEVFYSQPLVLQPARERLHPEPIKLNAKSKQDGREYNKLKQSSPQHREKEIKEPQSLIRKKRRKEFKKWGMKSFKLLHARILNP